MHTLRAIHFVIVVLSYLICSSGSGEGVPISLVRAHHNSRKIYRSSQQCSKASLFANREISINKKVIFEEKTVNFTENLHKQLKTKMPQVVEEMLDYSRKFRKLKFSLEQDELQSLADDVKHLCEKDMIGLFFVSAYFVRACELLESKKMPAIQISKLMKKKIKLLMHMTSIETYRRKKYGSLQESLYKENYWHHLQNDIFPFEPKNFNLSQQKNKDQQIQDIIVQMVGEAQRQFQLFNFITAQSCHSNEALFHHINFKIKAKHERAQMKRVKEKLLRDHFYKYQKIYLSKSTNISEKRTIEQSSFEAVLTKVYSELKQVQFVVKDILRAKCMFHRVSQIKMAIQHLKKLINQLRSSGRNIRIVEFENRLNKTTCDIIMIIQIDDLPCELQLALEFDEVQFQISHKMYELMRSKVFSPIVLLFDWFEKIAPQFLSKVGQTLLKSGKNSQNIIEVGKDEILSAESMLKQYELLNQFFNLTSYHDLETVSKQELQKELQVEISKVKQQIVFPYISMGPGPE